MPYTSCMAHLATYPNGRIKGQLALTREEHEWLLKAVPSGVVTPIEAAAKLSISLPTLAAWLKRPLGYEHPRYKLKNGAARQGKRRSPNPEAGLSADSVASIPSLQDHKEEEE